MAKKRRKKNIGERTAEVFKIIRAADHESQKVRILKAVANLLDLPNFTFYR